eukprot:1159835-Pelagomonas_calceolata.AAC.7
MSQRRVELKGKQASLGICACAHHYTVQCSKACLWENGPRGLGQVWVREATKLPSLSATMSLCCETGHSDRLFKLSWGPELSCLALQLMHVVPGAGCTIVCGARDTHHACMHVRMREPRSACALIGERGVICPLANRMHGNGGKAGGTKTMHTKTLSFLHTSSFPCTKGRVCWGLHHCSIASKRLASSFIETYIKALMLAQTCPIMRKVGHRVSNSTLLKTHGQRHLPPLPLWFFMLEAALVHLALTHHTCCSPNPSHSQICRSCAWISA